VRLGLTGGIGSGKSTVARLLAQCGAAVVDADAISRGLTAPLGLAIPLIATAFGQSFITASGALDRDRMRALIYADSSARQRLEAIIHPLVSQECQRQAAAAAAAGHGCIVFDVPLLVESGRWRQQVDQVLVVDCSSEVQIRRVMARSQLTQPEVEKIMASQADQLDRLGAADCVIFNATLSLDQLANEVRQLSARFGLSSGQYQGCPTP
jgi:dephospho-CoA kinase